MAATQQAWFGAGCFWSVEAPSGRLGRGVLESAFRKTVKAIEDQSAPVIAG